MATSWLTLLKNFTSCNHLELELELLAVGMVIIKNVSIFMDTLGLLQGN